MPVFNPTVKTGYVDILPSHTKDDAANGFTFGVITGNRQAWTANNQNSLKKLFNYYHVPHTIKFGQVDGDAFVHLHWESADNAAGNIIIVGRIFAALRDGSWTAEATVTWTLTPSTALSAGKQIVTELPLPAGLAAYLQPDAMYAISLERNRGANATDTYNNSFYYFTADIHAKSDGTPTTSKDEGSGWVKSN